MFTKRHFRQFAVTIKTLDFPPAMQNALIVSMSDMFKLDNPEFNESKFKEAAGFKKDTDIEKFIEVLNGNDVSYLKESGEVRQVPLNESNRDSVTEVVLGVEENIPSNVPAFFTAIRHTDESGTVSEYWGHYNLSAEIAEKDYLERIERGKLL